MSYLDDCYANCASSNQNGQFGNYFGQSVQTAVGYENGAVRIGAATIRNWWTSIAPVVEWVDSAALELFYCSILFPKMILQNKILQNQIFQN